MTGRVDRTDDQRLTLGDPDLVGDEVAAGHHLRHRMLDLESRVHLEEGRFAAVVDEELAGARTHVADRAREGQGGVSESLSEGWPDGG